MSIFYDWYENPQPQRQKDETISLHPRIHYNGSTTTAQLRRYIQDSCSLTEGDVDAVLSALSHFIAKELADGKSVHLNGIGYLSPTLGCTSVVTPSTKQKSSKVKLKGIHFRADKQFMRRMGAIHVELINQNDPMRSKYNDEEVEQQIRAYLQKHRFMSRRNLETLCGLSRTTALRHIRRLCEAGVLDNQGLPNQPVYCLKQTDAE